MIKELILSCALSIVIIHCADRLWSTEGHELKIVLSIVLTFTIPCLIYSVISIFEILDRRDNARKRLNNAANKLFND